MKNEKSMVIAGLDLGTVMSVIAMLDKNGIAVAIKNKEGQESTRSAVTFVPGAPPIIGQEAINAALLYPDRLAREMKQHIGEQDGQGNDVAMVLDSDDKPLTPAQVQGVVARKLIDDANAQTSSPVTDIVITVPANYGNRERKAIMALEKQLGCRILALVEEPVAAACAFVNACNPPDGYYLVFDMGAGTTDLSALEISGRNPRILATKGKGNLGGRRCDMALTEVIKKVALASGVDIEATTEPAILHELNDKAERAKITLTDSEKAQFYMNFEGKVVKTVLLRGDYEAACASIIAELRELAQAILEATKLAAGDFKGILLNGPSCQMPMILALLGEVFPGVPIRRDTNPVTAVAQGAALMAAKFAQQDGNQALSKDGVPLRALGGVVTLKSVATHALGCKYLVNGNQDTPAFAVIIPATTPLPTTMSDKFGLVSAAQTMVAVEVFQGEKDMPIDQCTPVATVNLEGIPAGDTGPQRVIVQYSYNRSGIVEVTVTDTVSKKTVSSNIDHDMGGI
jgi:molecular chaperone DnaK